MTDETALAPAEQRRRTWYQFGILGVFFALSAFVVVYLLTDVRAKMQELSSSPHDNVQWTLTQLEVEYLTLALLIERADAQNAATPLSPDLRPLRRAYDIVYSRVQTIRDGTLYEPAVSGGDIEEEFNHVATEIFALAALIDQPDAALLADLPEIRAKLSVLHPSVRRILTVGNRGLAYAADRKRNEISSVLIRVAAAATVLLITLTLMTLLFRREAQVSDRRLRENLATSARLETIFSTSRDAIVVIDRAGTVLNMNQAGKDMFGDPEGGKITPRIRKLLAREENNVLSPVSGRQLFASATSGRQTGLRLTGLRPDGSTFPVEISLDTSTGPSTPICVALIRDISHQVAVEQELKSSRDTARAGEKAKARFLGVVSHEMRTPLNGIIGAIDLIDAEGEKGIPQQQQSLATYLPVLRNSAKLLLNLVNDVLDLTQIEDGPKLHIRAFDLDAFLDEMVLTAQPTATQSGNTLTLVSDGGFGTVQGDVDRLRQIINNLIANAVKFTSDGTITLDVNRVSADMVEFQVMDTGQGMSEAELAQVFDDFYRTDTAIQNQIQGTGLGLGIVQSLVSAMGGQIGAESEPGEGSVFWVRLPLPANGHPTPKSKTTAPHAARPAKILLVEDNATNRLIAHRLLENDGHDVTEAVNGQECLDICAQEAFDLILMDISMPVLDGPTAAQRLRATPGPNQSTRLVILTAHLTEGLEDTLPMQAIDAILHKPMQRDRLIRQIDLALGQPPRAEDTETVPDTTPQDLLAALPARTRDKLIRAFVQEMDSVLPQLIAQASAPSDPSGRHLGDDIHALSGATASIGIMALHRTLSQAEHWARHNDRPKSLTALRRVANSWPDIRQDLKAQLLSDSEIVKTGD